MWPTGRIFWHPFILRNSHAAPDIKKHVRESHIRGKASTSYLQLCVNVRICARIAWHSALSCELFNCMCLKRTECRIALSFWRNICERRFLFFNAVHLREQTFYEFYERTFDTVVLFLQDYLLPLSVAVVWFCCLIKWRKCRER